MPTTSVCVTLLNAIMERESARGRIVPHKMGPRSRWRLRGGVHLGYGVFADSGPRRSPDTMTVSEVLKPWSGLDQDETALVVDAERPVGHA